MIPPNLRNKKIEIVTGNNRYIINSKEFDRSLSPSELMEFSFNEALNAVKLTDLYKNRKEV
ncbi:MAG: hypothetical protein QXD03_04810 [Candidatus Anstonellales archaeon]